MKILHLNNYAGGSGADLCFKASLEAFKLHSGFTNLSASTSNVPDQNLILSDWQSKKGLSKLSYIYSTENEKRLSEFLFEEQPDILHAHGYYSAISPSILVSIKKAKDEWGMKFVQSAHSHELICANASAFDYTQKRICTDCKGSNPKLKIFYRNCDRRGWLYSWAKGIRCLLAQNALKQVSLTDCIVCPSTLMLNNLVDEGLDKTKLELVRNICNVEQVDESERRNEIIFFGRFSKEKNLHCLIKAFARFHKTNNDWKLVLIGEGQEEPKLIETAALEGCSKHTEFLPFLKQDKLYQRLSQGKIMVMSSEVLENAPLVIPEAVMCGLYPITPQHGGMKESIDWLGIGSCYTSGSVEALTLAIYQGTESNIDFRNATDKIKQELSPETYVKRVSEIYLSLKPKIKLA